MPQYEIKRAAVLGAGTMGSQIAALLANNGIPCDLLDLATEGDPDRLVHQAMERLKTLKPPPLAGPKALDLIKPGNFTDDLSRLGETDWVVEAVAEDLDIKLKLWREVAPNLRPDVLISTNTSGIPIKSIVEALPARLRSRFMGTHFFNPPRYLRLLEVIPAPDTDPDVVESISRFAEDVLEKGVAISRDVPNFVSNRVGVYSLMAAVKTAQEFGLGPDEVDSITGPAMGRPRSATFRTLDLIGLDVLANVCATGIASAMGPDERDTLEVPDYISRMIERGWTGEKGGQGFYKRTKEDGKTRILTLDVDTLEYRTGRRLGAPSLSDAQALDDPGEKLKALIGADDVAGRFAWRVLSQAMAYAANMVGYASDDIVTLDRTMSWGFAWELGPFETWDALGVPETLARMRSDGLSPPEWVATLAERGRSFYVKDGETTLQATPEGTYVATS